jgi:hypothetical protein
MYFLIFTNSLLMMETPQLIEIRLDRLEEVYAQFAQLVPQLQKKTLKKLAQVAFDTAQRQADTHTVTGALARSLRLRPEGESAWIIDHNLQHAPHALFVHWGTRAHVIRHREKSVLRWATQNQKAFAKGSARGAQYLGKANSKKFGFVFAKEVHHPGYEGDAWLVKAADEAVRQFDAIVRRVQGAV